MKNILLTGGAGFIGSHVAVELLENNYNVVIADNLSNSDGTFIEKIQNITGKKLKFYKTDIRETDELREIFRENKIDAVINFAGLKAVGESVEKPIEYYDNNLISQIKLLEVMREFGVKKFLFSSSATVYGEGNSLPLNEDQPIGRGITNPYGWTKYMIEQILKDVAKSDPDFELTILRYFNPVGAHESGLIGDTTITSVMPFIQNVAIGKIDEIKVFGGDYPTQDGTCIRDYIHVVDLAKGHISALNKIKPGVNIFNLGAGKGVSVLEIIHSFESANNVKIPFEIVERRKGDLPEVYCSADKALKELGWKTEKTLEEMCHDSYNFAKNSSSEK